MKTSPVQAIAPRGAVAVVRLADGRAALALPRVAAAYARAVELAGGQAVNAILRPDYRRPGAWLVDAWATKPFSVEEPPISCGGDGFNWSATVGRSGWCPTAFRIQGVDIQSTTLLDGGWSVQEKEMVLTKMLSVGIGGNNNQMHIPAGTRVWVHGVGSRTGSGRPRQSARVTVLAPTAESERLRAEEQAADAAIAAFHAGDWERDRWERMPAAFAAAAERVAAGREAVGKRAAEEVYAQEAAAEEAADRAQREAEYAARKAEEAQREAEYAARKAEEARRVRRQEPEIRAAYQPDRGPQNLNPAFAGLALFLPD
jgi:hypothetical protein